MSKKEHTSDKPQTGNSSLGVVMHRVLKINSCSQCCHMIFDDGDKPKRWGKHWCIKLDKEVKADNIPDECPLPCA